ncbi:GPI mannosyltransferase 2 [Geopyxis carbonaria]|nr:GPI mannosyltransferase 2 [Geopyxis carbonaria]
MFAAWKFILCLIAIITPSPAYDTSTMIILLHSLEDRNWPTLWKITINTLSEICERLTRWDAIYFSKIAQRGYINEQEWAFGWGYTQLMTAVPLLQVYQPPSLYLDVLSGIIISNTCHLISVFVVYELTLLSSKPHVHSSNLAFLTSSLHILSPAGLFLSAPYSESLFSALNFIGSYLYILSLKKKYLEKQTLSCTLVILGAFTFALGCTVRSNGVLNGIIFLVDLIIELKTLLRRFNITCLCRILCLGIGGLIVAAGLVFPQIIAWRQFCTSMASHPGEWCEHGLPSVYFWVQDRYWNVGFLRYWKVSNVPLFLLAFPTLVVLLQSGIWGIRMSGKSYTTPSSTINSFVNCAAALRMALPQILLATMAIFTYHVQIVTRLSSGYVLIYWWIGSIFLQERLDDETNTHTPGTIKSVWIVRWMVMYSLIQGVLFAGFLPPA